MEQQKVTERKQITEAITSVDFEYMTLERIAEQIADLTKMYGKDATIAYHYPDYSDTKYLYVFRKRPENDKEMAKRIEYEAKQTAAREESDRREFERLKAKFKD
jgi:hypothetical protein